MSTCIHCGEPFEGGSAGERPVCVNCSNSFAFPPTQPVPTAKPTPALTPSFDAYYVWLGIPPAKQPPNHYQLLGLATLETNLAVIATAAERQAAHLRSFLGGPQACDAERLLAEVDAARDCLLSEHTKSAYDGVLSQVVQTQSLPATTTATASPRPAPALLSTSSDSTDDDDQRSDATPVRRRRAMPQRSPVRQFAQIVIGGIAGCAIGYYLGFVLIPSIRARGTESKTKPPTELAEPDTARQ